MTPWLPDTDSSAALRFCCVQPNEEVGLQISNANSAWIKDVSVPAMCGTAQCQPRVVLFGFSRVRTPPWRAVHGSSA